MLTYYVYIYIAVMMMGFSQQEARLGLRACNGDIQQAVSYVMKRKEVRISFNTQTYPHTHKSSN